VADNTQTVLYSSVRNNGGIITMVVTIVIKGTSADDTNLGQPGGTYIAVYPDGVANNNGALSAPDKTAYSSVPFCFCNEVKTVTQTNSTSTQTTQKRTGYRYPAGCSDTTTPCQYTLDITFDTTLKTVTFSTVTVTTIKKWVGVGLTTTKDMAFVDVYLAYVNSANKVVILDCHMQGGMITTDAHNDMIASEYKYNGGKAYFNVTLKQVTGDSEDVSLGTSNLVYIVYFKDGGDHTDTVVSPPAPPPAIDDTASCVCSDSGSGSGSGTTIQPPQGTVSGGQTTRSQYTGYRYPRGCDDTSTKCIYTADITLGSTAGTVNIGITATISRLRWCGIGFTATKLLKNIDLNACYMQGGTKPVCVDAFWPDGYGSNIEIDAQQDLTACTVGYNDASGVLSCNFTRKRDTGDTQDHLSLAPGYDRYKVYILGGGTCTGSDINPPEQTPTIDDQPSCTCSDKEVQQPAISPGGSTAAPPSGGGPSVSTGSPGSVPGVSHGAPGGGVTIGSPSGSGPGDSSGSPVGGGPGVSAGPPSGGGNTGQTGMPPVAVTQLPELHGQKYHGFKYPSDCSGDSCQYECNMTILNDNITMEINIRMKAADDSKWCAVGFSNSRTVNVVDFVGSYFDSSQTPQAFDGFYTSKTATSIIKDQQQDVTLKSLVLSNGFMIMDCTRLRVTSDTMQDLNLSAGRVYYIFYFIYGGAVKNGNLIPPGDDPVVTENRTCICTDTEADPPPPSGNPTGSPQTGNSEAPQAGPTTAPSQPAPSTAEAVSQAPSSSNSVEYPQGCSGDACSYRCTWTETSETITFVIRIRITITIRWWIYIGFSQITTGERIELVSAHFDSKNKPVFINSYVDGSGKQKKYPDQNFDGADSQQMVTRPRVRSQDRGPQRMAITQVLTSPVVFLCSLTLQNTVTMMTLCPQTRSSVIMCVWDVQKHQDQV